MHLRDVRSHLDIESCKRNKLRGALSEQVLEFGKKVPLESEEIKTKESCVKDFTSNSVMCQYII